MLATNTRKHSYRELSRRRIAGYVLMFLKDGSKTPENVYGPVLCKNDQRYFDELEHAYHIAHHSERINYSQLSPHVNEIKKLVQGRQTRAVTRIADMFTADQV